MFCTECGAQINDKAVMCPKCGSAILKNQVRVSATSDDVALRVLLPVGCSFWAILAGYLGLFSIIPFFGLLAIAVGICAILDIKAHPKKRGLVRTWFGIIMGIVSVLGWGLVLVLR